MRQIWEQLMRSIVLAAFITLLCLSAPAKAELLVAISKSQQRLAIVIDGAETHRWPVSTGRRGFETPSGSFHPIRLERHWYSRQYDRTPMPWAMFFYRGYAVHGTMEATNLGHAASHGCVRLRPDHAATLYGLMRRQGLANTNVVVMDGALPVSPDAPPTSPNAPPMSLDGKTMAQASAAEDVAEKAFASTNVYRVLAGSDEAQILREREVWLRGLDRKYGIAR
jgi:hypothetical protein